MRGNPVSMSAVKTLRSIPRVSTRLLAVGPRRTTATAPTTADLVNCRGMRRISHGRTAAAARTDATSKMLVAVKYTSMESASGPRAARSIGRVSGVESTRPTGMLIAV